MSFVRAASASNCPRIWNSFTWNIYFFSQSFIDSNNHFCISIWVRGCAFCTLGHNLTVLCSVTQMIPMPALILSCSHIYRGLCDFSKVLSFMSWHSKMFQTHRVLSIAALESAIPPRTPVVHCSGESTGNLDLGKKWAQVSNILSLSQEPESWNPKSCGCYAEFGSFPC